MIPIKKAKQIRVELGLTHLVIFGITPDGIQHVATHGDSKLNANEAANAGNKLKKELGWPLDLCNSKPIERICENCEYWQRNEIHYSERIPKPWPGKCLWLPQKIERYDKDIACCNLSPR